MAEESRNLSAWKKYKLLVWKNFLHLATTTELIPMIFVPVVILMLFIVMRCCFMAHDKEMTSTDALEFSKSWTALIRVIEYRKEYISQHSDTFTHNNLVPRTILGYAPDYYQGLENIMQMASKKLDYFEVQSFTDCEILREQMKKRFFFASICFDESSMLMTDGLYPFHLNFTIIFPSELRMYDDIIGSVWKPSNYRKDVTPFDYMKIQNRNHNYFISEGFLHIQHAILESYTSLITEGAWTETVQLKRFPLSHHHYDLLLFGGILWLPLLIIIAELYPVSYLTYAMVQEKKTMKPFLKVMGVENYLMLLAWITEGIVIEFMISLLLTLILKISYGVHNAYLESTSLLVILIFLLVYDIAALCFCFMVSTFSRNVTNVTAITTFYWALSFVPFLILIANPAISWKVRILLNLLPNTALASGFKIILEFEALGEGMGLGNFFESPTNKDEITLGWIILLLLVSAGLCIVIGLVVELLIRLPYKFNVRWTQFWKKQIAKQSANLAYPMTVVQIDPEYKQISVDLKNVCKQFDGTEVVRQVSMTLYENEITVLLGHNGCGKTTLLSMIAGLIQPTSGTIRAMDLDVSRYSHLIDYGIFMDHAMLFDYFTVEENLLFYTRLKGLKREETERELVKYLDLVGLSRRKKTLTNQLSPGQRQLLAVCCALTGRSKIVILDEPFLYLDLFSRGKLVDLLTTEKNGRTICLASHFCDIAEAIGDRIVIMSSGGIRCIGNSYFLRKIYGVGYILVILKGPLCRTVDVEKHIKKFIPNIVFQSEIGAEVSYILGSKYTPVFPDLLEEIEANFEKLGLTNCTIYENALEHIFYAWGDADSSEKSRHRFIGILNGKTVYEEEYNNLLFMKNEFVSGSRLWFNQVKAMILKRLFFDWYHIYYRLLQILVMLIFVGFASFQIMSKISLPSETISISLIQQMRTRTVVSSQSENYNEIDNQYREAIMHIGYPHLLEDTNGELVSDYILNKDIIFLGYQVGATFADDNILAWYNFFPMHTPSLSLSLIFEAIVRGHLFTDSSINLSFEVLPLDVVSRYRIDPHGGANAMVALLSFFYIFKWSTVQIFLVQERVSTFKKIQFACGISTAIFWIGALVYDSIKMFIINALFVLVMCTVIGFQAFPATFIASYYFLLCVCGISVTMWNYAASMWFRDPITAYIFTLIFHLVGGLIFCALIVTLIPNEMEFIESEVAYVWLMRLWPLFSLCAATVKMLYIKDMKRLCANEDIKLLSMTMEKCKKVPNCCVDWKIWSWEHGIQPEILCLSLTILTSMYVFVINENYKSWSRKFTTKDDTKFKYESDFEDHEWRHNAMDFSKEDEAVVKERLKVYRFSTNYLRTVPVVCDRLGKRIGGKAVIKNIFLSLDRGEAFGLLGVAGSGKSIFLEMLAGERRIDCGQLYLHGINVSNNLGRINSKIGYCPNKNPFMLEYRAKQVLEMIALIRGVRNQEVEKVCVNLVKVLGLFPHYNQQLLHYSLGTGRRFSCAMAMLGNSPILILERVSAGADPASRRYLWNILCRMRQVGATVLFSTDNAYECEVIANRVAFMSEGSFASIGTIRELNQNFSTGYVLTVKLRPELRRRSRNSLKIANYRRTIVNFVQNTFKNSSLQKYDGNQIFFLIPAEAYTINTIFGIMQRGSYNLQVEDFEISRMNLGIVFNDFAEKRAQSYNSESNYTIFSHPM